LQVSLKSVLFALRLRKNCCGALAQYFHGFGAKIASLIDGAKLRQLHCGFRIFVRLFFLKNVKFLLPFFLNNR